MSGPPFFFFVCLFVCSVGDVTQPERVLSSRPGARGGGGRNPATTAAGFTHPDSFYASAAEDRAEDRALEGDSAGKVVGVRGELVPSCCLGC